MSGDPADRQVEIRMFGCVGVDVDPLRVVTSYERPNLGRALHNPLMAVCGFARTLGFSQNA